jgi:hypothetical protein
MPYALSCMARSGATPACTAQHSMARHASVSTQFRFASDQPYGLHTSFSLHAGLANLTSLCRKLHMPVVSYRLQGPYMYPIIRFNGSTALCPPTWSVASSAADIWQPPNFALWQLTARGSTAHWGYSPGSVKPCRGTPPAEVVRVAGWMRQGTTNRQAGECG